MEKIFSKTKELENKGIIKFTLFLVILFTLIPPFQDLNKLTNSVLTYSFFLVFAIESLFRLSLLIWRIQAQIRGSFVRDGGWRGIIIDTILWIVDLFAAISFLEFLPFGDSLRILRLLRLIKLSRYFSNIFRELSQIVSRKSIRRQFVIVFILIFSISFVVGLIFFVGLNQDIFQNIWWSFKTLFDPGEMINPDEMDNMENNIVIVKTIFSFSLTLVGLLILSFFIGIGTQVVQNLIEITKDKKLNYKNHIIIYGWTDGGEIILAEILNVMEDNQILKKVILLQDVDKKLEDTIELKFRDIISRHYSHNTYDALEKVSIESADTVIIFGQARIDENDDPEIIKKILAVREINNSNLYLISLIKEEKNKIPAKEVGADIVIVRDSFMGFYMCQNILKPELKNFYYEVLTSSGSEFYSNKVEDFKLENFKGKRIAYLSLYMELLKKGCTFVGVIKKKSNFIGEKLSPHDISSDDFTVNPLQYYDKEKKEMIYANGFYAEEIDGIIALANNGIAFYNSLQEINFHSIVFNSEMIEENMSEIPKSNSKTKYSEINNRSIGKIIIFGWNNSVPSLIQQLSSNVSFEEGITLFLHSDYKYEEKDFKNIKKNIMGLLSLYYDEEKTIKSIMEKINIVIGDYFSQTDLFDSGLAYLQDKETIIVVPDIKKASDPDADVFLLLLTFLGILKNELSLNRMKHLEDLRIYAQVNNDRVGRKLDEILEKVNTKIKSSGENKNNVIDRFNIIYSEKILNYLLVQHLTNKYTQKIFTAIMTNDDMNSIIMLSEELIKETEEIQKCVNQKGIIKYEDICKYLLINRITPVGYKYIDNEGHIESYINPNAENRIINLNKRYPCIVVIGNYENEIIKKYDRNR